MNPEVRRGWRAAVAGVMQKNNEQAAEDLSGSTAVADKQQVLADVPFDEHAAAGLQEDDVWMHLE